MALEMQKMCMTLTAPDGSPVVMRIGLHFGPLVAGVVGGNMLRYHLFGAAMDAVTQLEQACRLGGVRLSEMFAMILRPSDPRWRGADDTYPEAGLDDQRFPSMPGGAMEEYGPGNSMRGGGVSSTDNPSFEIPASRRLRGARPIPAHRLAVFEAQNLKAASDVASLEKRSLASLEASEESMFDLETAEFMVLAGASPALKAPFRFDCTGCI